MKFGFSFGVIMVLASLKSFALPSHTLVCEGTSKIKHRLVVSSPRPQNYHPYSEGIMWDLDKAPQRVRTAEIVCTERVWELLHKSVTVACSVMWEEERPDRYPLITKVKFTRSGNQITMESDAGVKRNGWGSPIPLKSNCRIQ